jgi:hypothetical protein
MMRAAQAGLRKPRRFDRPMNAETRDQVLAPVANFCIEERARMM